METAAVLAPFKSLPRSSMREIVAGRILTAVMQGELPAGQRMILQRLAAQLGVSATPVREALFELAGIGIVDLLPNRGAVLREFGPRQLQEIYQIRRVLEVEAIQGAFGRIRPEVLGAIAQELHQLQIEPRVTAYSEAGWSDRAMEIDVRLHACIAQSCGSDRLIHEIDRYNTLIQVVREVVHNEHHAQEVAIVAHLKIIDELLNGSRDSAARAMGEHIDTTAEIVGAAMFPVTRQATSTTNMTGSRVATAAVPGSDKRVPA